MLTELNAATTPLLGTRRRNEADQEAFYRSMGAVVNKSPTLRPTMWLVLEAHQSAQTITLGWRDVGQLVLSSATGIPALGSAIPYPNPSAEFASKNNLSPGFFSTISFWPNASLGQFALSDLVNKILGSLSKAYNNLVRYDQRPEAERLNEFGRKNYSYYAKHAFYGLFFVMVLCVLTGIAILPSAANVLDDKGNKDPILDETQLQPSFMIGFLNSLPGQVELILITYFALMLYSVSNMMSAATRPVADFVKEKIIYRNSPADLAAIQAKKAIHSLYDLANKSLISDLENVEYMMQAGGNQETTDFLANRINAKATVEDGTEAIRAIRQISNQIPPGMNCPEPSPLNFRAQAFRYLLLTLVFSSVSYIMCVLNKKEDAAWNNALLAINAVLLALLYGQSIYSRTNPSNKNSFEVKLLDAIIDSAIITSILGMAGYDMGTRSPFALLFTKLGIEVSKDSIGAYVGGDSFAVPFIYLAAYMASKDFGHELSKRILEIRYHYHAHGSSWSSLLRDLKHADNWRRLARVPFSWQMHPLLMIPLSVLCRVLIGFSFGTAQTLSDEQFGEAISTWLLAAPTFINAASLNGMGAQPILDAMCVFGGRTVFSVVDLATYLMKYCRPEKRFQVGDNKQANIVAPETSSTRLKYHYLAFKTAVLAKFKGIDPMNLFLRLLEVVLPTHYRDLSPDLKLLQKNNLTDFLENVAHYPKKEVEADAIAERMLNNPKQAKLTSYQIEQLCVFYFGTETIYGVPLDLHLGKILQTARLSKVSHHPATHDNLNYQSTVSQHNNSSSFWGTDAPRSGKYGALDDRTAELLLNGR